MPILKKYKKITLTLKLSMVFLLTGIYFCYSMDIDKMKPTLSDKVEFILNEDNIINSLKKSFKEKIKNGECEKADVFLFSTIRFSKQREYLPVLKILPLKEEERQKQYIKNNVIKPLQKRFLDLLEKNLISFDLVQLFGMQLFSNQKKYIDELNLVSDAMIFESLSKKTEFSNPEEREKFIEIFVTNSLKPDVKKDLSNGTLTETGLKLFQSIAFPKQYKHYETIKNNPFLKIPISDFKQKKQSEIALSKEVIQKNMIKVRASIRESVQFALLTEKISESDLSLFQTIHFSKHHKYYPMLLEGTLKKNRCFNLAEETYLQQFQSSLLPFLRFGLNTYIFSLNDLKILEGKSEDEQLVIYQDLFKKVFLNQLGIIHDFPSLHEMKKEQLPVVLDINRTTNLNPTPTILIESPIMLIPTNEIELPINVEPTVEIELLINVEPTVRNEIPINVEPTIEEVQEESKNKSSLSRKEKRKMRKKEIKKRKRTERLQSTLADQQSALQNVMPMQQTKVSINIQEPIPAVTTTTTVLKDPQEREDKGSAKVQDYQVDGLGRRIKPKNRPDNHPQNVPTITSNLPSVLPNKATNSLPLHVIFNLKSGPLSVDHEIENDTWDITRNQMGNYFSAMWCCFDKGAGKGGHYKVLLPTSCTLLSNSQVAFSVKNENGGSLTLPNWEQSFRDGKPLSYLRTDILEAREKLRLFYEDIMNACKDAGIDLKNKKMKIDLDIAY